LQIPKEQETDQEVTWEDQQKINVFSRLNVTFQDLEELYKEKKVICLAVPWMPLSKPGTFPW
jgi:hypothetical protein